MATWNSSESQQASSSSGTFYHVSLQVKLGLPLHETLHNDRLPCQLVEMLAYIAHEGVTTTDIFRQPGSTADLAVIVADLTAGRLVNFMDYNFYTLASLTKKFLLKIPGGLFGAEVEDELLEVMNFKKRLQKYEAINSIITKLPLATQQLTSLLLGTWFRIVNHSEYNTMSSDAVAKSVAHCLFHSVANDPCRQQRTIQLLQILIDDFSMVYMLGAKNIQYFADVTRTRVSVQEKRHSQTHASTLSSAWRARVPKVPEENVARVSEVAISTVELGFENSNQVVSSNPSGSNGADREESLVVCVREGMDCIAAKGALVVLFLILIFFAQSAFILYGIWRILLGLLLLGLNSENQWSWSSKQRSSLRQPDTVIEICPPTPSPPFVPCSPSSSCRDAGVSQWNQSWLNQQASMSAPDVNKTTASPSHDFLSAGSVYISSSLNRFDNVKRRRMLQMKRRTHWFLGPNDDLYPHVTVSPSQPMLGGAAVETGDEERSTTHLFNVATPNNGLSIVSNVDQTATLSSRHHALIPHLEVTSPHDNDYRPLKNHLPVAGHSSSSEHDPASFAQVAGSCNSNTAVGEDCAGKR